jgi:hypothetical protein
LNIYLLFNFLFWNVGMLECWNVGTPIAIGGNVGMLERWKNDLPIGKR